MGAVLLHLEDMDRALVGDLLVVIPHPDMDQASVEGPWEVILHQDMDQVLGEEL